MWSLYLTILTLVSVHGIPVDPSTCRFSPLFSTSDISSDPSKFLETVFKAESKFHANNIGYNAVNGMTYDGTLLNYTTGLANATGLHPFSASSKESLQLMMYSKVLSGDPLASLWIGYHDVEQAKEEVVGILKKKINVLNRFNESFPGFGGMVPWFYANETDIRPTFDWVNRIPALDNG